MNTAAEEAFRKAIKEINQRYANKLDEVFNKNRRLANEMINAGQKAHKVAANTEAIDQALARKAFMQEMDEASETFRAAFRKEMRETHGPVDRWPMQHDSSEIDAFFAAPRLKTQQETEVKSRRSAAKERKEATAATPRKPNAQQNTKAKDGRNTRKRKTRKRKMKETKGRAVDA